MSSSAPIRRGDVPQPYLLDRYAIDPEALWIGGALAEMARKDPRGAAYAEQAEEARRLERVRVMKAMARKEQERDERR